MTTLHSDLFVNADPKTVQALEDCANGRPSEVASHFGLNANGEHVKRVQQALANIVRADAALQSAMSREKVPPIVANGKYDASFARAVEIYKRERKITNYRNQIDNIVGIKTIRSLDAENQRQNPGPRPVPVLPDIPRPEPVLPDTPPLDTPGFRDSGWKISGISGLTGTIPTPIPGLTAGLGVQTLTLENPWRKEVAQYALSGLAVSFGADLEKRLPFLKSVLTGILKRLKGRGGSIGPASFPTFGSEIFVTPWVKEPVEAREFACFAAITSLGAGFGLAASGNAIVFSIAPFIPVGIAGTATIKGVGVFASSGLSPPNASADAFHARSTLKSVGQLTS